MQSAENSWQLTTIDDWLDALEMLASFTTPTSATGAAALLAIAPASAAQGPTGWRWHAEARRGISAVADERTRRHVRTSTRWTIDHASTLRRQDPRRALFRHRRVPCDQIRRALLRSYAKRTRKADTSAAAVIGTCRVASWAPKTRLGSCLGSSRPCVAEVYAA